MSLHGPEPAHRIRLDMLLDSVRRGVPAGLLAVYAAAVIGCNGDSPVSGPVVVITPPPPVTSVLTPQPIGVPVPNGAWVLLPIPLTVKGVLEIKVDWTLNDTYLYNYFGRARCDEFQLTKNNCPFDIRVETKTPKPRTIVTPALEAGTYYLYFYNVPWDLMTRTGTDADESAQVQLTLTVSATGERRPLPLPTELQPAR